MQNATLINNPPITKGVPVLLQAVSSDGSVTDIGTVTTDAGGHFTYDWTPQQTGLYTITAYFAGDDSYWSSWTETGLSVKTAQTSDNGAAQPGATADYTLVLAGMAIAIIILAILVVYQIFRKK